MHDIVKAMNKTQEALSLVRKYFGTDSLFSFEDNTEKYWSFTGNKSGIVFDTIDWTLDDREPDYGYDIRGTPFEKDEYTLMKVDDGCGEKFYIILDNSKRIEDA